MSNVGSPNDPLQVPEAANIPAGFALPQASSNSIPTQQPYNAPIPVALNSVGPAQDLDTIEMAWASRVEELFHRYGNDPRLLSQQFSALKAEYIMKRYGKDINNPQVNKG